MKKGLIVLLILFGWVAVGQNQPLLYNFESQPQSLLLNPGTEPAFNFHAGVPFLSKVHFSGGSTGVTLYDIFKIDESSSLSDRIKGSLASMRTRDFVSIHQQVELLSVGWRGENDAYYSAGIYQELDLFSYIPSDLALMVWDRNLTETRHFDFSDIAFTAEVLNVFHFGITKKQHRNLTLGFRGKIYSSALNIRSTGNTGEYAMLPGSVENNYIPLVRKADMQIRSAGLGPLVDTDGTYKQLRDELSGGLFFGGSLGLGVDFGFTRRFDYNWKVSGSVTDLGFIYNFKDVETYEYWGDSEGATEVLEYEYPEGRPLEKVGNLITDLEQLFMDDTFYDSYISMRPIKLNATIDYGWGEDLEPCDYLRRPVRKRFNNYLGVHMFSVFRPNGPVSAASLYYDGKITSGLRGKLSYTVDSFSYTNIGALVSAQVGWVNLYVAADNLLSYGNLAKAHNASVQMGVQLIVN